MDSRPWKSEDTSGLQMEGDAGSGWFMTIHWCPCACNEFAPSVCVCVCVCVVLCGLNDCKSQAFRSAQMKNLLSLSVLSFMERV